MEQLSSKSFYCSLGTGGYVSECQHRGRDLIISPKLLLLLSPSDNSVLVRIRADKAHTAFNGLVLLVKGKGGAKYLVDFTSKKLLSSREDKLEKHFIGECPLIPKHRPLPFELREQLTWFTIVVKGSWSFRVAHCQKIEKTFGAFVHEKPLLNLQG